LTAGVPPAGATDAGRGPSGKPLTLRAHTSPDVFDRIRDEWIALEARAEEKNIFQTWAWQHAWWAELGTGALDLLTLRDGERLVAIVPAYHEVEGNRKVLRFGGGLEVTDYLGFIVEPGYAPAVAVTFLRRCMEFDDLDVDLHFLRSDGGTLKALLAAAQQLGIPYRLEDEEVSPRIPLERDWESYLARLDKKDRHELRRKRRRLEAAGGWTVREATSETLAADLEVFFDLHAKSSKAKADFLTPVVAEFFRHICHDLLREGWLSLQTLVHAGTPGACALAFRYDGKLLAYNAGYEPELNKLSVGLVLMSELIRGAIEAGLTEVDFLRGNEKYKYDLGAEDVSLMHLHVGAQRAG
jgi:CelD/BcsL family acetyltransferase involved in cellulose biosynthesis